MCHGWLVQPCLNGTRTAGQASRGTSKLTPSDHPDGGRVGGAFGGVLGDLADAVDDCLMLGAVQNCSVLRRERVRWSAVLRRQRVDSLPGFGEAFAGDVATFDRLDQRVDGAVAEVCFFARGE